MQIRDVMTLEVRLVRPNETIQEAASAMAEIDAGLRYLSTQRPSGGAGIWLPDMQFFYGHYYAAQAMWTARGTWWADWFPAIRDSLLDKQQADDSWKDAIDTHYATAMACIILQIPNNYLPILEK